MSEARFCREKEDTWKAFIYSSPLGRWCVEQSPISAATHARLQYSRAPTFYASNRRLVFPKRPEAGGARGIRRRTAATSMSPSADAPRLAKSRYRGGAEIHHRLIEGGSFEGERLAVTYEVTCDELESLQTRLTRRDPTMGLIDPTKLVRCGGDARDVARVAVFGAEPDASDASAETPSFAAPLRFDVFVYLAHLAGEASVLASALEGDDDSSDASAGSEEAEAARMRAAFARDEADARAFFEDGSFTGTLLWDAALRCADHVLCSSEWRARLRGATVVELGCGVGLLGLIAATCGCETAVLTDREKLRGLCEDNASSWRRTLSRARANKDEGVPNVFFHAFEWTDANAASALLDTLRSLRDENARVRDDGDTGDARETRPLSRRDDAKVVDVVFAADCVFGGLFGSPAPLAAALSALCDSATVVLLATERRPGDGVEAFRETIDLTFDRQVVRVVGPDGGAPAGGVGDVALETLRLKRAFH